MIDGRSLTDPALRHLFEAFPVPSVHLDGLTALRGWRPELNVARSEQVERTDHVVVGDPPVPVRVHRPLGAEGQLPALIDIHGGGLIVGSHKAADVTFDRWCPMFGVVGISVGYRLAPETPYPGAIEDSYAALIWTYQHARELGIDPARIGIGGMSAGGGIAAALGLLARDRGEVPVAFQFLNSPMLDDRQITPSSQLDGLYVWSREDNAFGWRSYLGELYGSENVPLYAAPARATDLSSLPPTFLAVGEADGFRDEVIEFATRLFQAGVACELHVYPGLPHGFAVAAAAPVVQQALRHREDWLARHLGSTGD
jgi:acetyl esterase/lipase